MQGLDGAKRNETLVDAKRGKFSCTLDTSYCKSTTSTASLAYQKENAGYVFCRRDAEMHLSLPRLRESVQVYTVSQLAKTAPSTCTCLLAHWPPNPSVYRYCVKRSFLCLSRSVAVAVAVAFSLLQSVLHACARTPLPYQRTTHFGKGATRYRKYLEKRAHWAEEGELPEQEYLRCGR